jgi:sec-independent protein translocase protein TatA
MAGLGWQELVIILVIIMIIFGAGKLPEIAKSLGQGVKEFREEANAPVVPARTTASATTDSVQSDVNSAAADANQRLDNAADTVRAETSRDAI